MLCVSQEIETEIEIENFPEEDQNTRIISEITADRIIEASFRYDGGVRIIEDDFDSVYNSHYPEEHPEEYQTDNKTADDDRKVSIEYKEVTGHIIFSMKIDFTFKVQ